MATTPKDATENQAGQASLATQAETDAGTNNTKIVTSLKLKNTPLPDPFVAAKIDYTPGAAPAHSEGRTFYDSGSHSLSYYNDEADVTLNIGREMMIRVKNETGSPIGNGELVYIDGSESVEDIPTIDLAQADAAATSKVLGMATHSIEDGTFGYVTTAGIVHDLNTATFTDGDTLWLSPTVAGGYTITEPFNPNKKVIIGCIAKADASVGKIFIQQINLSSVTIKTRFGWAIPSTDDAVATEHSIITSKGNRLVAVTVDGVPTDQNHVDSNTSPILVNITTFTSGTTLRFTGTKYDPSTGNETPAFVEDKTITGTGYVLTDTHWRGTVVLSSEGGLDVVLDSFLFDPFTFGKDFILDSVQVWYKSTAVSNSSRIVIQRFNLATGFTSLFDETISDITNNTKGAHHRDSLNATIAESGGDALFIFIETKRLTDVHFEVGGVEV